MSKLISAMTQHEQLNFLLTNRVPRRLLTHFMGWYSKIESPRLARFSIKLWKIFANDLDLSESKKQEFSSLHDCFIRELKEGVRPVDQDPAVITSPCDAIIGAFGTIENGVVYQAKGFPYSMDELVLDSELPKHFQNGCYVTLRLKSSMYHRFHAPVDCEINEINYISGDTWNVNPVALKRIEKLYCKNERAVVELKIGEGGKKVLLVPVAAILVASMKFHCLDVRLDLKYEGPNHLVCSARYKKGDEMGYFQHGSTILIFASSHYELCEWIKTGDQINMGQTLLIEKRHFNEIKLS